MIRWREAFDRQKDSQQFQTYFGKGRAVQPTDFRYLAYVQRFENVPVGTVTGGATPSTPVTPGAVQGPSLQTFPAGALILGITGAAIQSQTTTSAFQYAPSYNKGRRDLFAVSFQYTNDELITPGGPVLAEALFGSGEDTIFPAREIIVPPSQGLLASIVAYAVVVPLNVHLVYHAMVPRALG